MSTLGQVSVIIPTMATFQRAALLQRAIASIRRSSHARVSIIVVVNGNAHDAGLLEWLREQKDVLLELLQFPSAPKAVHRGVKLVDTPYYSTLDDDDEFLDSALDKRVLAISRGDGFDLLVTDGYRRQDGADRLWHGCLPEVQRGPLPALMRANWLTSGNALYRRSSIGPELFEDGHPFAEWTWLAYKAVAQGKRIGVLDEPTFAINDTPGSLSKSRGYVESFIPLFKRMLDLQPSSEVSRLLHQKLGAAYHDASNAALEEGRIVDAWGLHARSMLERGGSRYLAYTRHLIKATL